jgi:MFS family permease
MSQPNQFSLLKQRRFAPFFWTQFLGAFNDNLFKTALVVIITFDALSWTTHVAVAITNLIPGLFILPYVLFSATAGQLADKFEKSGLTRFVKWLEVGIMCVAGIGWVTHHLWLLIAAVVGMGVHSTLFGPVKYAYLPQQLKPEELIGGNGVTEMGTFVGILMGEVLGAVLVVQQPHGLLLEAAATICVAALGWPRRTAFRFAGTGAGSQDQLELRRRIDPQHQFLAQEPHGVPVHAGQLVVLVLRRAGAGAVPGVRQGLSAWRPRRLRAAADDLLAGRGQRFAAVRAPVRPQGGNRPGAVRLDRPDGVRRRPVFRQPGVQQHRGAGVHLDALALLAQHGMWRILFDVLMIGMFGGFFIVPLFALIQLRCDPAHISRTIAGMNILNALFMVAAAWPSCCWVRACRSRSCSW